MNKKKYSNNPIWNEFRIFMLREKKIKFVYKILNRIWIEFRQLNSCLLSFEENLFFVLSMYLWLGWVLIQVSHWILIEWFRYLYKITQITTTTLSHCTFSISIIIWNEIGSSVLRSLKKLQLYTSSCFGFPLLAFALDSLYLLLLTLQSYRNTWFFFSLLCFCLFLLWWIGHWLTCLFTVLGWYH